MRQHLIGASGCRRFGIRCGSGVSLLELLMALFILSGGLIMFLQLFIYGVGRSAQARSISVATLRAQEKMEELLRDGHTSKMVANPQDGYEVHFYDTTGREVFPEKPEFYIGNVRPTTVYDINGNRISPSWQVAVSLVEDDPLLRKVLVRTFWVERNRLRQLEVVTYLAQRR